MGKANPLSAQATALATAKALWQELKGGLGSTAKGEPQREVWSPEMRAYYRTVIGPRPASAPWQSLPAFTRRLEAALAQVTSAERAPAVLVFQLFEPAASGGSSGAAELGLGLELRREDLPTRLAENRFAVALLRADARVEEIGSRLERALCQWAGGPVSVGVARYPSDGQTAQELLRRATYRCQVNAAERFNLATE